MPMHVATPKKFHLVTGLHEDFGGKPFGFANYMALRSAMVLNPEFEVYVYFKYQPTGPYWELVKNDVVCVAVEPPTEIFGRRLRHFAHKTDVIRLRALLEHGGVYMDFDTICQKPITPLLQSGVVMGVESSATGIQQWNDGHQLGLCNAMIIAPPKAEFLQIWLESFKEFDDDHWNSHAVLKPGTLARQHPDLLHVEPPESFFWPLWTPEGINALFVEDQTYPSAYSFHLWESISWPHLKKLDVDRVMHHDTTYNRIARRFVERDRAPLTDIATRHRSDQVEATTQVFTTIYSEKRWGTGSGTGAVAAQNIDYRHFLETFMKNNDVESVLDFGCGDWQFSRYLDWSNRRYLGLDVVRSVVDQNTAQFAMDNVTFQQFQSFEQLPNVDLILCKDVLQHLDNDTCAEYLRQLAMKTKFLLVTNDAGPEDRINIEIEPGAWRPIKLDRAPFKLQASVIFTWDVRDDFGPHRKVTYLMYGTK